MSRRRAWLSIAIASVAACAAMEGCSFVASLDDIRVGSGADASDDATEDAAEVVVPDAAVEAAIDAPTDGRVTPTEIQAFSYTGANQTFQVPAGVRSLLVKAWGAAGGCNGAGITRGGSGGYVETWIDVPANASLRIVVGGGGTQQVGANPRTFGGGGSGSSHTTYAWSGAGGGFSSLGIMGAGQQVHLVLAGGGGGCGYYDGSTSSSGAGGSGCGHPSRDGRGGDATPSVGGGPGGGGGGLLDMGGARGSAPASSPGNPGAFTQGGDGLFDMATAMTSGGGGGGLYGGGSGAWAVGQVSGAGGGGSCKGPPGATFAVADPASTDPDFDPGTALGGQSGKGKDGRIVLRWAKP